MLAEFFSTLVAWDRSKTNDEEKDIADDDSYSQSEVVAAAVAAALAGKQGNDTTKAGKNGVFTRGKKAGEPIKCWLCDDVDHVKSDCPKNDGRDNDRARGGKPNGRRQRDRGRKREDDDGGSTSKKTKALEICPFFAKDDSCRFGDRCKWDHPPAMRPHKPQAAAVGFGSPQQGYGAPPPPAFGSPPPGFQVRGHGEGG